MQTKDLLTRIDSLINKGVVVAAQKKVGYHESSPYVDHDLYAGFRSISLSFIASLFGSTNVYYTEFVKEVNNSYESNIKSGISILHSIRYEIENGWLSSIKKLVAAELFSDFLEMSKYLLDGGYKDAAAVMIGSVLEENLRRLCVDNLIDLTFLKGSDWVPKKADLLNVDLVKANIYGVLEQKSVTMWLDLRNRAAHGKYSEYTIEQVELMYAGVLDFVTRFH